jgi:osmoprotectant transport system permease protein
MMISVFLDAAVFQVNRIDMGHRVSLYELYRSLSVLLIMSLILIEAFKLKDRSIVLKRWILFIYALLPSLFLYLLMQGSILFTFNRMALSLGFYAFMSAMWIYLSQFERSSFNQAVLFIALFLVIIFGSSSKLSFVLEYQNNAAALLNESLTHLSLVFFSVLISILPAWYLARLAHQNKRLKSLIMAFVNFFQVIPTLSFLTLLMIPLSILATMYPFLRTFGISGIGFTPAFIVLSSYALMPMTAQIYAGFESIDEAIIEAGVGMGLNPKQIFRKIMLPLSLPNFVVGLRVALLQNISSAVLAGLVGGGGLGALIFLGLSQSASDLILLATLPLLVMSRMSEKMCDYFEHKLIQSGVKQ